MYFEIDLFKSPFLALTIAAAFFNDRDRMYNYWSNYSLQY